MLYLFGSAFCFSVMSVLVKLGSRRLPSMELVMARGVVTLVLSYAALELMRVQIWGHDRLRLLLRGTFGFLALSCFFYALSRLPLADTTVIHYLNPLFATLFATVLLGERAGAGLWVAIALCLAGVVLVTQPAALFGGDAALPLDGVLAALGGALCSALAYVTVRRLRHTDHPLVIVFYFPLVAVPATLPFCGSFIWPHGWEWAVLAGIGVATQIAQILLTRGLALVPAGRGTAAGYVQIAFAAVWGAALFDELPDRWTVAGGALICVGVLLLLVRRGGAGGRRSIKAPPAPGR